MNNQTQSITHIKQAQLSDRWGISQYSQERRLYASVVIDFFSRRVIGGSLSSRATSEAVMDASPMAI